MYLERAENTCIAALGEGAMFLYKERYYVVVPEQFGDHDMERARVRAIAIQTPAGKVGFLQRTSETTLSWEIQVTKLLFCVEPPPKEQLMRLRSALVDLKNELRAKGFTDAQMEEILK